MLAIERQNAIRNLVRETGSVTLSELVAMFGVSSETIRKDLLTLEKTGILSRTHGGAISTAKKGIFIPLKERKTDHLPEKQELCGYAIRHIRNGDTIAIDEGSTATELAKQIVCTFSKLTIATHSLEVFEILAQNPGFDLILFGGTFDREEMAFYGRQTLAAVGQHHFDKCFLFPSGVSLQYGLMDYLSDFLDVQDAYIAHSTQTYILAYSDRFEKPARVKLRDVDPGFIYITDSRLPPEIVARYEQHHIKIIKE